jgi:8-oxo-dGTP diphosphatase
MSGKIIEGELNLSNEHEGYAWVWMENLKDYELVDWLQDYVSQKNSTTGNSNLEKDSEDSENSLTPWLKSIRSAVDKMGGKK